ncbi:MAG: MBL fold metallo-hydrolase [Ignavibacteriales bacterium]|nr:MBL fold metallo-hydrolase [Ignavibacteriales bacterium]
MKIKFWGVRGSIPTPGKSTVHYGGNTPSIELRLHNGDLVILDAGTGIRGLGDSLITNGESLRTFLMVTHPHWDHIQGFPFFKPAFISGNEITIVGTERPEISLQRIIAEQMTRIYFPVQLNELKATIHFRPVREEEFPVFGATVRTLYMNHPGFTVGYRIEQKGKSVVYISDNEPFDRHVAGSMPNMEAAVLESFSSATGDPNQRVFDFARKADILIHDCTYTPEEYIDKVGWGHSHYLYTLEVAAEAGVRHLVLFHHEPNRSDDNVNEILRKCRKEIKTKGYRFTCTAAREGVELSC